MSEEPESIPQEESQLEPPSPQPPVHVGVGTPDPASEPGRPVSVRKLAKLVREHVANILDATDAAVAAFIGEWRRKRDEL